MADGSIVIVPVPTCDIQTGATIISSSAGSARVGSHPAAGADTRLTG
jgi:hypothetical protein